MNRLTGLLGTHRPFAIYPNKMTEYKSGQLTPSRVQIAEGPEQFSLLIQHREGHYCAYEFVPKHRFDSTVWSETEFEALGVPVSYVGYSTNVITWMGATGRAELRHPVQVSDPVANPAGDFWVGTHFALESNPMAKFETFRDIARHWFWGKP